MISIFHKFRAILVSVRVSLLLWQKMILKIILKLANYGLNLKVLTFLTFCIRTFKFWKEKYINNLKIARFLEVEKNMSIITIKKISRNLCFKSLILIKLVKLKFYQTNKINKWGKNFLISYSIWIPLK